MEFCMCYICATGKHELCIIYDNTYTDVIIGGLRCYYVLEFSLVHYHNSLDLAKAPYAYTRPNPNYKTLVAVILTDYIKYKANL